MDYPEWGDPSMYAVPTIKITNHSIQPAYRPQITSLGIARPPVRWGRSQTLVDEYVATEVLPPNTTHAVPFEHVNVRGGAIDTTRMATNLIKTWVDVDAVTVTFTDVNGIRWSRTGYSEPVRVL